MRTLPALLTGLLLSFAVLDSMAQTVDKSGYTLFNPVPEDQLRPLASETYDGFPDARTLDAGHVQLESALVDYSFDSTTPYRYDRDTYDWNPRITVGVLNNVDFFIRPSFDIVNHYFRGDSDDFGAVNTGVKVNLWGNDGGITAFAIRPYLAVPTGGGDVLGGSDLALLVRLPQGFSLKFDSEFYATEQNLGTLYAGFENNLSVNKELCAKMDAYWYLDTTITTDSMQQWLGKTGLGLEYNFTGNLQLFGGMGFGLTRSTSVAGETRTYDYNPRVGFVWRF